MKASALKTKQKEKLIRILGTKPKQIAMGIKTGKTEENKSPTEDEQSHNKATPVTTTTNPTNPRVLVYKPRTHLKNQK